MEHLKTIFVTGATGNQGSAVVQGLSDAGFKVKALTRNVASANVKNLSSPNIEWVQGDLNHMDTYRNHLKDVDGVFCVLTYVNGVEKEKMQGLNLVRLAKEYGVKHFLYSSVIGCDLKTGIPHWESKHVIENSIKQTGIPFTIIRPASFYENFLFPQVKSRILKGILPSPVNKSKRQQFLSAKDIGPVSLKIFRDPDKYLGRTIILATEEMDMGEVAHVLSEELGRQIKYQKMPNLITRLVLGKNLYKMFNWVNENNAVFVKDVDALHKEFPNPTSLKQWISCHFK